ncbi:hypothetical protein [Luteimicrobium sp. DT211]|uniref:hypothetical protein n=1 Tax=Luteimicrobium sp. DT211 TaxID=3393412 RepID=UPI003CF8162F
MAAGPVHGGPRFVASVDVARPARNKLLEVLVQVLTRRAEHVPARQLHALRNGQGATSGQHVRDDGAACFRVSLQVNAPSARRLHFWTLPDGTVELSRVVLHDDVEP